MPTISATEEHTIERIRTKHSLESLFEHSVDDFLGILTSPDFVTNMHVPMLKVYYRLVGANMRSCSNVRLYGSASSNSDTLDASIRRSVYSDIIPQLVLDIVTVEVFRTRTKDLLFSKSSLCNSTWMNCLCLHERLLLGLFEHLEPDPKVYFDVGIDIVDYVYRKVSSLPELHEDLCRSPNLNSGSPDWMRVHDENHAKSEDFQVCIQSLNVLRVIVSTLRDCPLAVASRVFSKYDVPYLLCMLIDLQVWIRTHPTREGEREKFRDGSWKRFTSQVCQAEASSWISLLLLMSSEEFRSGAYQLTHTRIEALLRLRKYLCEGIMDQIPQLRDLQRVLEELNVTRSIGAGYSCLLTKASSPGGHSLSPFAITEVETESFYTRLMTRDFINKIPTFSPMEVQGMCKAFAETYEDIVLEIEKVTEEVHEVIPPLCKVCRGKADQRCSQCKAVVYCSESCQLKDWDSSHKFVCVKN